MFQTSHSPTTNFRAIADKIEDKYIRYPHTDEDKQGLQAKIADSTMRLEDLDRELKSFQSSMKLKIDAAKGEVKLATASLRLGYEEQKQECFGIANYENGMMEYFTSEGVMVDSRRLLPDEKQTFLRPL